MGYNIDMWKQAKRYREWWVTGFFALLIIGFTLIVWREQKSGGTCSQQRQSNDAENSVHPLGNAIPGLIDKGASPQETEQASADSENYFCRLIAPANLPTDYLVLIGIGGVFIAISSLKAIRQQAFATEKAAEAALKNINLMISKERVSIRVIPIHLELVPTDKGCETRYQVLCSGPSDADILDTGVQVDVVDSEDAKRSPLMAIEELPVVVFNKGGFNCFNCSVWKNLSPDTIEEINKGAKIARIYGFIQYRDVFKIGRTTAFQYAWRNPSGWAKSRTGNEETADNEEN